MANGYKNFIMDNFCFAGDNRVLSSGYLAAFEENGKRH
jgi:hypothetical protein